jgi:lipopolysaccharide/colanic/teichoic acid biosynthesis glycosyltransferase
MFKRIFDLAIILPLAVPLAVSALVVALLVRLKLGSPVLFRQLRPGIEGRIFTMYKFRTMTDGRDACGRLLPDAARLTTFGRWLRASSLDELPELINVIKGDMSLVGPRPLLPEYLPLYSPEQARRHDVRPGITGWAQVNGRNALSWEEKFDHDVWYVNNHSLALDLKILVMTIGRVLGREGVVEEGSATAERFVGSPASMSAEKRDGRS